MVCGNVLIDFKEPIDLSAMPTLQVTFFVMTMDKTGHIVNVWPTDYDDRTRAQLRKQARVLLKRMIDDPYNPVDSTMAPALAGAGSSTV